MRRCGLSSWVVVAVCLGVGLSAGGCKASYPASPTPPADIAQFVVHYGASYERLPVGAALTFVAYTISSEREYRDVTAQAEWFSSEPAIGRISGPGRLTGTGVGTMNVVAALGGRTASLAVDVGPLSLPRLLVSGWDVRTVGRDAVPFVSLLGAGSSAVSGQASWTSSDPSVITVSPTLITVVGPGTAHLTVTAAGLTATLHTSVGPRRCAEIC